MKNLVLKHLRPNTVAAMATVAGVLFSAPLAVARAQSAAARIDTTFAFGKNGWVDATTISGTIIVTGWTRPEAHVVARTERGLIEPLFTSNRITLSPRPERYSRNRDRMGETYYEISVPIGTRVMVNATNGDIRVRGTGAEVQAGTTSGNVEVVDASERVVAQTTSGDIRLNRIRGRTRVTVTSGDIELDDITGSLEINSVSSDMRIRHVDVADLRIGTTSGDITYEGAIDPGGTYEITSHSGDIRFEMPSNTGAALSLQTYSGDIDSAYPMTLQPGQDLRRIRGRRMEFTIGNGGARVAITTFSGNITIARGPARGPREE